MTHKDRFNFRILVNFEFELKYSGGFVDESFYIYSSDISFNGLYVSEHELITQLEEIFQDKYVLGDRFYFPRQMRGDEDIYYHYYNSFIFHGEIEQCTGIKDKNGKLIYEGDIVEDGLHRRGVIEWNKYTACFIVVFHDGDNREFGEIDISTFKVIGNIRKNKELFK